MRSICRAYQRHPRLEAGVNRQPDNRVIPTNLRFGGGATATALNPLVALLILAAGLVICFGRRERR